MFLKYLQYKINKDKVAKIKGLDKVLKELKQFGKEAEKEIDDVTDAVALEIVDDAKQLAPVDIGKLRQGIGKQKKEELNRTIFAREKYSAYIEFGTGGLVNVPNELKELAIQFKGKGVKQINIKPQPYLYPALLNGRKVYLDELKQLLKELSK